MGAYGQGASASLGERRRTRQIRVGSVPIGGGADVAMMVPPEGRAEMRRRIYRFREVYPIFLADFWNDGPEVGGCMAARTYLHINASGDVVAVHRGSLRGATGLGYAVPVRLLIPLLPAPAHRQLGISDF